MNNEQHWYKSAVFYEVYVRAFYDSDGDGQGDLQGLAQKLDYLQGLGVTTIWLLPITNSPLRDDGYDVSDHYNLYPPYGTMQDFRLLVDEAHHRGLRIMVELVPNHTSDQHAWFQASCNPEHPEHQRYRDYYVWSETDQIYSSARIIFLDYEESNWTFHPLRKAFYWHRFFHHQPDLNYDNPEVQRAVLRVIQFWIDQGADGIRVDAPPYLYEREGTSCENLPETHTFLKRLRCFVDAYAPGTLLLSEANQWPEDVRPYFGDGDEFHMNFHFPLMPRIFMALAQGERTPLEQILARTPALPDNCQWGAFLRNHDELTLEMVTPEERKSMWDIYAPEPRMRLNLGIRRRLAPLLGNQPAMIRVANSILFTLIGSPFLYYGDEIGMGDNIWLDDRNGLRTPMQWDGSANAGFSQAAAGHLYAPVIEGGEFDYRQVNVAEQEKDTASLLRWTRQALRIRSQHPAFGAGSLSILPLPNSAILAYLRQTQGESVLVVNNLSSGFHPIDLTSIGLQSASITSLFTSLPEEQAISTDREFVLEPYGFRWYQCDKNKTDAP
jgi:maltose alpha-D-glucosyltransferase/alpha-amylase